MGSMCSVIWIPPVSSGTWRVSSVSTASRRHRRHPHHPRVRVVLPRPNRLLRLPLPFRTSTHSYGGVVTGSGSPLGICRINSPDTSVTKDGVLVTSVADDSAAAKAGIKAGDVITSFNGTDVTTPADLRRRIQRLADGDEFTVGVMRDKKPLTLKGKADEARPTLVRT